MIKMLGVAVAAFWLSGCATIMNGPTQPIQITTNPPGATCRVGDFHVISPAVVPLRRGPGDYSVSCKAAGYETSTASIYSTESGWIIANIFNGLIPGLIVDSISEDSTVYFPDSVNLMLERSR